MPRVRIEECTVFAYECTVTGPCMMTATAQGSTPSTSPLVFSVGMYNLQDGHTLLSYLKLMPDSLIIVYVTQISATV